MPQMRLLLSRFSHVRPVRPHRRVALQPTRHSCPWDSPGKNTEVGCHFLLARRESEVAQLCPTQRPHGLQALHPWDFPSKNTGVGHHCLLPNEPRCLKTISFSLWHYCPYFTDEKTELHRCSVTCSVHPSNRVWYKHISNSKMNGFSALPVILNFFRLFT